jgi:hypothetical protein
MVHRVELGQASSRVLSFSLISNISLVFLSHFRLKTTVITTSERNHGTIKNDSGPSKIGIAV